MSVKRYNGPVLFPELRLTPDNPWFSRPSVTNIEFAKKASGFTTLEVCAGAGGQALGFHQAGIEHIGLVEWDRHACSTLKANRPDWQVIQEDLNSFDARGFKGVDILSGGLPCPPFSVAGKQLGKADERNLFPAMVRIVDEVRPRAIMIENVRGILDAVFHDYRKFVSGELGKFGYVTGWKLLNASDFGVSQLRPRVVFVALKKELASHFNWPYEWGEKPKTVGELLFDLMSENNWKGTKKWKGLANEIAPTIVGGSLKHGGPDLGPTRARKAWATLGVDGLGIANDPPSKDFQGIPRLTVRMVARIQGFPDDWQFVGTKTQAYRQVGNAFPPPFARAIALSLRECLLASNKSSFSVAG